MKRKMPVLLAAIPLLLAPKCPTDDTAEERTGGQELTCDPSQADITGDSALQAYIDIDAENDGCSLGSGFSEDAAFVYTTFADGSLTEASPNPPWVLIDCEDVDACVTSGDWTYLEPGDGPFEATLRNEEAGFDVIFNAEASDTDADDVADLLEVMAFIKYTL
jgi:hypothetical protein